MTKTLKSGEDKSKDNFLTGDNVYGGSYETEPSKPLIDEGKGKQVVLRRFDFELPPMKKEERPTKETLLQFHKSKIIAFLWKDELEPISDFKIRISKSFRKFRIFVLCQAKKGSLIFNQPLLLQNVLNAKRN